MGTGLEITLWGADRTEALAASEAAVRALEATEKRLSTWAGDSELARFNAAAVGERHPLSPELAHDLHAAAGWWAATGGAFDPAVGAAVRLWGLREGGRRPSEAELARFLPPVTLAALRLEADHATRTDPRLVLEEGAFGKGAGLDEALHELRRRNIERALVDLGGQLAFLPGGTPCRVAVSSPDDRHTPVVELDVVQPGSLATTGNSERGFEVDGVRFSHVLDPRSASPAPDFGSASVLAPSAFAADCLSTALYVLGPDEAIAWWRSHPEECEGIEFLLLQRSSTAGGWQGIATPGLRGRLRPLVGDLSLRFLDDCQRTEDPSYSATRRVAHPRLGR